MGQVQTNGGVAMTVAEANRIGDQHTLEELVLFLSAPEPQDVAQISDPIAIFGTESLDDSLPAERF
jgi:hypothetical protein